MAVVADHAVRDVRVHGHRVLDAIVVAVRDDVWGTYPADVRAVSVDDGVFELRGTHGDVFEWSGRLEVTDAAVRFAMRGRALRDFDSQRVGVVLLHPIGLAGRDFRTDVGGGSFGVAVDPAPVASGFRTLSYDVGCPVEIELDGPPFEMEDHRNWSDPGWKSYCPPLGAGGPRRWRAGEGIEQSVTVRARPDALPAVGRYGTDHLDLFEGTPLPAVAPASVALIGRSPQWMDEAARAVAAGATRVAVFDPSSHTTAPGAAARVRAALRDLGSTALVGGGSRAHLAELNRLAPPVDEWDFVAFPITAQAHHGDTPSVLATALAQPAMVAQARRIAPGLPIVVGPLAFRRRQGANSPAAPHDPADPRESEPLCAAWLLGCVLGLRGADAVTVLLADARPTADLLGRLGALRGRPFVDAPTGRPDVLAATVLGRGSATGGAGGAGPVTLVANLGVEPYHGLGTTVPGPGIAVFHQEGDA